MSEQERLVEPLGTVPPAFYDDIEPPPPPPNDPHWREWPHDGSEPVPPWLALGLPAVLVVVCILHFALFFFVVSHT